MARRISLVDINSRRRRVRRMLFWGGILIAFALLVYGAFWAVAYSDIFKVREVEISGTTYVPESDIREFLDSKVAQGLISGLLGAENILAWPGEFKEEDLTSLPAVLSMDVEKHFFKRGITVQVQERERIGIWCFATADPKRCFWFDRVGTIFMPAYYVEGNLIPRLDDHSRDPLVLGDAVLQTRFMSSLTSIFSALADTHLSIREIRLDDLDKEEITAYTREGPRLMFSLRFPVAGVPDAIDAVQEAASLSTLEYIDFRVENKVYYR